jgi:heme exporter protein B
VPGLVAVLALADLGVALVGTLVGAIGVQARARELVVAIVTLPLLVPVVIGTARALEPLLLEGGAEPVPGRWLLILGLYDLVFGLLAVAVFDPLLED